VREVQAYDRAAAFAQHGGVTRRLRLDERAEREVTAGYVEVLDGITGDLQEDTGRRSALVVLPGGVEESRPPAERRGAAGALGDELPGAGEVGVLVAIEVDLQRDVAVIEVQLAEQPAHCLGDRAAAVPVDVDPVD